MLPSASHNITPNIYLCTPLVLENPDNAPIILTPMQELYLDRLLDLEFGKSHNGAYARRCGCMRRYWGFGAQVGFGIGNLARWRAMVIGETMWSEGLGSKISRLKGRGMRSQC